MTDLVALKALNERRWANAKLTRARAPEFKAPAQKAVANKARYQAIEARTGVSWIFIAVSHYRESTQNFSKSLAQGDPWNKVSTHVPAGRGPFASFEDAAVDALVKCAPHGARNKDWSIGVCSRCWSNITAYPMPMPIDQVPTFGPARISIRSAKSWSITDRSRRS